VRVQHPRRGRGGAAVLDADPAPSWLLLDLDLLLDALGSAIVDSGWQGFTFWAAAGCAIRALSRREGHGERWWLGVGA
jgi:hypothetical protein